MPVMIITILLISLRSHYYEANDTNFLLLHFFETSHQLHSPDPFQVCVALDMAFYDRT